MNKKIITIALMLLLTIFGCSKENKNIEVKPKPKAPLVKVEELKPVAIIKSVKLTGTVEAKVLSTIIAPSDGYIEKLNVQENQLVRKEKVIAMISPQERTSLISQAKYKVETIESQMKKMSSNNTELSQLNSQLEQAKKELGYAEKLYLGIPIISPLTGTITEKFVESGSAVVAKQNICTIVDFNSLVIKTSVSEDLFSKINPGNQLKVKFNAFPETNFIAKVTLKYKQIDPATRNFPVELKIINGSNQIVPGMMCELEMVTDKKDKALTVPNDVFIVNQKGEKLVYVVKDTVAHQKIVTTGISNEKVTEVISGLNEGEKIVVMGQELLKDGIKVMVQKPKPTKTEMNNGTESKKVSGKKK